MLVSEALAEHGFEPYRADSAIRMRNCPFHPLATREPDLVCGINRAYLDGILEGVGADRRMIAELAPRAGECCVQIRPG